MNKYVFLISLLCTLVARAETVEKIVALVGSEAILQSDFKIVQEKAKNPLTLNPYLTTDPSLLAKGDHKATLDYLIGEKIVASEVKRLNLAVTAEKVENEIKNIAKRNNMSVDGLYLQIQNEGLSKAEYQGTMRDNLERQALLEQEVASKIRITDEDALGEYLKKHPDTHISIDEFSVAHIFFSPKKGGAEQAQARAQAVLKKLESGESFEALAAQYSEDPNFTTGGVLGTFKTGDFLPEIEAAVSPLSPGQTTQIVRSHLGFHIVKLTGKKIATDPRFEKEKDSIKGRLMDQAVQRQFRLWLQSKRDDSFIRINN